MSGNMYDSHPLMAVSHATKCLCCHVATKNPSGFCSMCWHEMEESARIEAEWDAHVAEQTRMHEEQLDAEAEEAEYRAIATRIEDALNAEWV